MTRTALTIDVVSDVVCPWCYVGKRRLEAALDKCPDLDVTVAWQPFQLSPDMPREGIRRREHYATIFGIERAEQIRASMQQTGDEEGIAFGDDPEAMSPNTLSAHVLLYRASVDDDVDANALAEKLFHAHHVTCEDIGDHAVLARLAEEVGMDADDVRARLASGEDEQMVRDRIAHFASRGVTGVPFFVINDQYGISGAQPAEVLAATLDQIAESVSDT